MEPMKAGLITSEVVGVSPTGKSFRVVRACARSVCLVRSEPYNYTRRRFGINIIILEGVFVLG